MRITKVIARNYKSLREIDLELNEDINIIVGDNECGKSTLLEVINLALTFQISGRNVQHEISPHLFNKSVSDEYLTSLKRNENPELPRILVELYFENDPSISSLKGSMNSSGHDVPGVKVEIAFNDDFSSEYKHYISGALDKV